MACSALGLDPGGGCSGILHGNGIPESCRQCGVTPGLSFSAIPMEMVFPLADRVPWDWSRSLTHEFRSQLCHLSVEWGDAHLFEESGLDCMCVICKVPDPDDGSRRSSLRAIDPCRGVSPLHVTGEKTGSESGRWPRGYLSENWGLNAVVLLSLCSGTIFLLPL